MIKVSESLNGAIENFLVVTPQIQNHMLRRDNPHAVSKESVGLSNVLNEKQATEKQYMEHINGQVKHSAEDIMYDNVTLKEKIENLSQNNAISEIEEIKEESSEIKKDCAEIKKECAEIKNELEKGSIILKGTVTTDTFDSVVHLPIEGDERFATGGELTMPQGGSAIFECNIIATDSEHKFMKGFVLKGVCMNCAGAIIYSVSGNYLSDMGYISDGVSAYAEVMINYIDGNYGLFVVGDNMPLYWQATVEFKNFTQFSD